MSLNFPTDNSWERSFSQMNQHLNSPEPAAVEVNERTTYLLSRAPSQTNISFLSVPGQHNVSGILQQQQEYRSLPNAKCVTWNTNGLHESNQETRMMQGQQEHNWGSDVTYEQNTRKIALPPTPTEMQNKQHEFILAQSRKGINIPKGAEVIVQKTFVRFDQNNPVQTTNLGREYRETSSTRSSVSSQEMDSSFDQSTLKRGVVLSPSQMLQIKSGMDYESGNSLKLDPRYFGELLAEVKRKTSEVHSILSDNVQKIKGKRYYLELNKEYNDSNEDIESLIPKGVSELTKQQIRYLLQMRITVDRSLRLLLSTFRSLREDLLHLQDDLNRLTSDKEMLERDVNFKSQQLKEYIQIVETVRDSNRSLQNSIKENSTNNRSLEELVLTLRNSEADKEFRVKELEYSKRALEQEIEALRQQLTRSPSSASINSSFNLEISNNYYEMVNKLREEKDKEVNALRSQINSLKQHMSSDEDNSSSLKMKLMEYMSMLSEKETRIKEQHEEIMRLKSSSRGPDKNISQTIITKRYLEYPILGLLKDSKAISPSKGIYSITTGRI
ncbi:protein POF1B isoform X1 [Callorhinchus milii]|uniref:Protein POF1B n=3 Tax=Callorhinchus milii TaxID=7868 RepID=V9KDM0_CALMI|nr:protein POF1B isoform X1 [Callorhinchus milii]XP_007890114.1 protein POF1B isoform X1 [Callorhinchus milii]|eukprot:gi/632935445/ref/XP_007890104.1/ PREDICTED: protein POF1B isoform X1 [Callorhinchus milii]